MAQYENYKNPTDSEVRAMKKVFSATKSMRGIIKEMKRDYDGFKGYGKVYEQGDNYPVFYRGE